jgi:hypothetical protein
MRHLHGGHDSNGPAIARLEMDKIHTLESLMQ